ncbi:MAG: glycosyltransferase [Flavobacteriales bacterium]|nr:glycosyltransferase [Flavobacteriales bacterium]
MPKITIITVCRNSADTLKDTLQSVGNQAYPDLEYLVIDGASEDNTREIVEQFGAHVTQFISEPDQGMYHAVNKGMALATGEVIGLLHADDFYADDQVLRRVGEAFENPDVDAIYGDLEYVDKQRTEHVVRYWKSGNYAPGKFLYGWMPPHPTFFIRTHLVDKYGPYRSDFRSAADYEFMLRLIHRYRIHLKYIPEVLVKMRVGGKSNVTMDNRWRANQEDRMAWKVNGMTPYFVTLYLKPLRKLGQWLKRRS